MAVCDPWEEIACSVPASGATSWKFIPLHDEEPHQRRDHPLPPHHPLLHTHHLLAAGPGQGGGREYAQVCIWRSYYTTVRMHLTIRTSDKDLIPLPVCQGTGWVLSPGVVCISKPLSHLTVITQFPGIRSVRCFDSGWELGSSSVQFSGTLSGTWENLSEKKLSNFG